MRTHTTIFAVLILLTGIAEGQTPNATSGAQLAERKIEPAKEQAIREFFDLTKVGQGLLDGMRMGLESQKAAQPNVPDIFWEEFIKRAETNIGEFLTIMVGVYDRNFTRQEINAMLSFYSTPLGRVMAEKQPKIARETMQEAETWGMKLGLKVASDLVEKGLFKP